MFKWILNIMFMWSEFVSIFDDFINLNKFSLQIIKPIIDFSKLHKCVVEQQLGTWIDWLNKFNYSFIVYITNI